MSTMDPNLLFAHTPRDAGGGGHLLEDHLREVAQLALARAESSHLGGLAYWAGLLHDLGKARPEFQSYLQACFEGRHADRALHSKWGAAIGWKLTPQSGREIRAVLTLPVLGHHSGLKDFSEAENDLEELCINQVEGLNQLQTFLSKIADDHAPKLILEQKTRHRQEFAIRFVFSCLVDADRFDTANFYGRVPPTHNPTIGTMWETFERFQKRYLDGLGESDRARPVNQVRKEVYEACLDVAKGPPGVYRLTVPTGGGKTRSSLAFALRHAIVHQKRRVIVGIPFTSIIDQTAKEYREILGEDAVLEYHSQVVEDAHAMSEEQDPVLVRRRFQEENWDFPLIVTTTVQLFESLMTHRPSRARKIQSIANSVVILDEVQTLPTEVLSPTLNVLQTLVQDYGVTVVLCTATQPAFAKTPFGTELGGREINTQAPQHFERLKRVEYAWVQEKKPWADIAQWVASERQGLVVVNSRRGAVALAREVLSRVPDSGSVFHLSTLLCSAHRRNALEEIRRRLREHEAVQLVSTQVVEAGVDVDFPVVWRAMAPLDRIIQVAGRCNREGKLEGRGRVTLFEPSEESPPLGAYRAGVGTARSLLLRSTSVTRTLEDPESITHYFEELYAELALDNGFDKKGIQQLRDEWAFEQVGKKYRLIEDDTSPVVVDYQVPGHAGEGPRLSKKWEMNRSRATWRRLQPYLVTLRRRDIKEAENQGLMSWVSEGLAIWRGKYDPLFGISLDANDPVDLVK